MSYQLDAMSLQFALNRCVRWHTSHRQSSLPPARGRTSIPCCLHRSLLDRNACVRGGRSSCALFWSLIYMSWSDYPEGERLGRGQRTEAEQRAESAHTRLVLCSRASLMAELNNNLCRMRLVSMSAILGQGRVCGAHGVDVSGWADWYRS